MTRLYHGPPESKLVTHVMETTGPALAGVTAAGTNEVVPVYAGSGIFSPPSHRRLNCNGDFSVNHISIGDTLVSVTTSPVYICENWTGAALGGGVFSAQIVTTAPPTTEWPRYLTLAVTTADASLAASDQYRLNFGIEGYQMRAARFGTSSARNVRISFWVFSSIAGTYSGAFVNAGSNRHYPFTYTINAASTWEQKSVQIPGDTTGTWDSTNGVGATIRICLGAGSGLLNTAGVWTASASIGATGTTQWISTSGATFRIGDVQVEHDITSFATPFERLRWDEERLWTFRYHPIFVNPTAAARILGTAMRISTTNSFSNAQFPVPIRTNYTGITVSNVADFAVINQSFGSFIQSSAIVAYTAVMTNMGVVDVTTASLGLGGDTMSYWGFWSVANAFIRFTGAELV